MEAMDLKQTPSGVENSTNILSMSRYTKILCWTVLPGLACLVLVASPITAISLPVLLLPAGLLLWLETKVERNRRANFETWVWTFFVSGTVATILVSMVQALICYGLALVLFGSETDKYMEEFARKDVDFLDPEQRATRQQMSQKLTYWLLLAISSFNVIGVSEEFIKYRALLFLRNRKALTHEHLYITYALAAAVGFSTFENIGFVYASSQVDSASRLALTLFERVFICTPATLVMAGMIGINMMRRDVRKENLNLVQILGLSVVFHGLFDFMLMAVSALNGNIGWVHPRDVFSTTVALAMAMAIVTTAAIILQRRLKQYQTKCDNITIYKT